MDCDWSVRFLGLNYRSPQRNILPIRSPALKCGADYYSTVVEGGGGGGRQHKNSAEGSANREVIADNLFIDHKTVY